MTSGGEQFVNLRSVRQLNLNIDVARDANARYGVQNPFVRAHVHYALVDAHLPALPVPAAPSSVHAVAAGRLHAWDLEYLGR